MLRISLYAIVAFIGMTSAAFADPISAATVAILKTDELQCWVGSAQ
ncbi:MAG: hypothetical protein JSR78_16210 [Proteobacteria bacterium]|nr:hypothetical protein [Pseudomonadota bacterium]